MRVKVLFFSQGAETAYSHNRKLVQISLIGSGDNAAEKSPDSNALV